MEQLPSNSKADKAARKEATVKKKEIVKVVSSPGKVAKKSVGTRFRDLMFGGQDAKTVWGHALTEIVIPSGKEIILDSINTIVEGILFRNDDHRPQRSVGSKLVQGAGQVAYNRFSSSSNSTIRSSGSTFGGGGSRQMSERAQRRHEFGEIILANRAEAREVIDQMVMIADKFGEVSVSELYDMVDVSGSYIDEKWGWELQDLSTADVRHVRGGGFRLLLTDPKPLA